MRNFITPGIGTTIASLALLLVVVGCGHPGIEPSDDPTGIPFDLIIPDQPSGYDYYVQVGTKGEQRKTYIDTVEHVVTVWGFFAQFYADGGQPVPYDVLINFSEMDRHHGGDTLRLRSSSDTGILTGDQTWRIREEGDSRQDLTRFIVPLVSLLDTIGPFESKRDSKGSLRSDTSLTIRWKPGASGGNIKIEWRAPKTTVVRDARDFEGQVTLPAAVMTNLVGEGTVIVTRFRSVQHDFNGKSIFAQRLSQRTYDVRVQ